MAVAVAASMAVAMTMVAAVAATEAVAMAITAAVAVAMAVAQWLRFTESEAVVIFRVSS